MKADKKQSLLQNRQLPQKENHFAKHSHTQGMNMFYIIIYI